MTLKQKITSLAKAARQAAALMLQVTSQQKNSVLEAMAVSLVRNKAKLLQANRKDLAAAKQAGLDKSFIDRLTLNQERIHQMSGALVAIAKLADPVASEIKAWSRPNGLEIHKIRVPIGVIAVIYESRPNVTADCVGLCFKAGNSVILRGGSEALNSNLAIFNLLQDVVKKHHLPGGVLNLITTTDRQAVDTLLKLNHYIDLVMPRGGEELIKRVLRISRIPVIKHYKGICHVYVDEEANLNMAERICFNAKVQRPGVCNAMECMLVHEGIAARFLPGMLKKFKEAGVEIRGCAMTRKIASRLSWRHGLSGWVKKATDKDYFSEYLDLILSVKVVTDLDAAVKHINHYGSHHSDAIVTEDKQRSRQFLREVDSACVYLNASTRFTDGGQFGMGGEIGISTDKLHARGPVALEELTTYKYIVLGNGQIRE
jgi:glutamate-5-semialdehyde dehydrogenase